MGRVFLICWEFPGVNSKGGTALSKRPGYLARGLKHHGFEIIIITRNHFSDSLEIKEDTFPVHIVPGPPIASTISILFLRRLATVFYTMFLGDRSGIWGLRVYYYLKKKI